MNFAERLRELRNENQCTQKTLANYLGLTPNSVCEWENKRSEPSLGSLYKMATYFGVSTDYLLGLEDDFGAHTATLMSDEHTKEERKFIEDLRKLTPGMRDILRTTLNAMLDDSKTEDKI